MKRIQPHANRNHILAILFGCLAVLAILSAGCTTCTDTCQGQCYDPATQSCCGGKVYPGNWSTCGSACYDTESAVCYEEKVYDGSEWKILGTWEPGAGSTVTMTALPDRTVRISPFPACGNRYLYDKYRWNCSSSVLRDGTWAWDRDQRKYFLNFTYRDMWDSTGFEFSYAKYGYGFDPNADYNDYKLRLPSLQPADSHFEFVENVSFAAAFDAKDPDLLQWSLPVQPVMPIDDPNVTSMPYNMDWVVEEYGSWKKVT